MKWSSTKYWTAYCRKLHTHFEVTNFHWKSQPDISCRDDNNGTNNWEISPELFVINGPIFILLWANKIILIKIFTTIFHHFTTEVFTVFLYSKLITLSIFSNIINCLRNHVAAVTLILSPLNFNNKMNKKKTLWKKEPTHSKAPQRGGEAAATSSWCSSSDPLIPDPSWVSPCVWVGSTLLLPTFCSLFSFRLQHTRAHTRYPDNWRGWGWGWSWEWGWRRRGCAPCARPLLQSQEREIRVCFILKGALCLSRPVGISKMIQLFVLTFFFLL